MNKIYSFFDQLCAISYLSLAANHPMTARYQDVRRCTDMLSNH